MTDNHDARGGENPANKVKAALDGALGFLKLRDEVVSILEERLEYSPEACGIEGHDECAERIILLFADLLTDRPAAQKEDSSHVG